jgi:3-oxoadipate enol-lactonase
MPTIQSNGCPIHVEVEGPDNKPVLMLSNSLGTDLHMWDPQVAALTQHFRLVRYDRRGHGKSGVPKGPYTMEMLGRDVLAVLDALKIERINWCGLSMGGMVGMWLGANAPQRINRLILSNTSAYFADKEIWNGRIKTVREKGLASIVGGTMERWFTPDFREREPKKIEWLSKMFLARKAISRAARRCATWTTARSSRRSPCRRWSSRAGTIPPPPLSIANSSAAVSRAPA